MTRAPNNGFAFIEKTKTTPAARVTANPLKKTLDGIARA